VYLCNPLHPNLLVLRAVFALSEENRRVVIPRFACLSMCMYMSLYNLHMNRQSTGGWKAGCMADEMKKTGKNFSGDCFELIRVQSKKGRGCTEGKRWSNIILKKCV
jgi:hypothetical protein